MLHQVVEYLNSKVGGNHDYPDIALNLGNIEIAIEIIVGQINVNDIFSKPLTKEVKNELVFKSAVCFD